MAELKIDFAKMAEGFTKTAKEKGMFVGWWIPVSEGLPDKYGIYLVTLNNHDTDFCEFYPNDRTFGMNGNVCYEVTAWMPLPPCYEPQESEDT